MTDQSDPPLGFCEFCGAKRIIVGQSHCASCGRKLLQSSEVTLRPVTPVAAAETQATPEATERSVAPAVQAVVEVPAPQAVPVAAIPEPVAFSIPNQPPVWTEPAGLTHRPAISRDTVASSPSGIGTVPSNGSTTLDVRRAASPRKYFLIGAIALGLAVGVDVPTAILVIQAGSAPSDSIILLFLLAVLVSMLALGVTSVTWLAAIQNARQNRLVAPIEPGTVLAGLHSLDDDTRVKSAKQLSLLVGSDARSAALACVTDNVPAVRYYALRSLLKGSFISTTRRADLDFSGFQGLAALLAQFDSAGDAARTAVLRDLKSLGSENSPFQRLDGFATRARMTGKLVDAVRSAINLCRTDRSDLARQMLVELASQERMPKVQLMGESTGSISVFWPRRCCICGTPDPRAKVPLTGSGRESHDEPGHIVYSTRDVSFELPACEGCAPRARSALRLGVGMKWVNIGGLNPEFAADLMKYNADWATA